MPTKQVTLRLGDTAIDALNYLCLLAHQSQASLVADLILLAAQAVDTDARAHNATLAHDLDLVRHGGTLISVEEQKAFQTMRRRLAGP